LRKGGYGGASHHHGGAQQCGTERTLGHVSPRFSSESLPGDTLLPLNANRVGAFLYNIEKRPKRLVNPHVDTSNLV
jgi:hypothetical protein